MIPLKVSDIVSQGPDCHLFSSSKTQTQFVGTKKLDQHTCSNIMFKKKHKRMVISIANRLVLLRSLCGPNTNVLGRSFVVARRSESTERPQQQASFRYGLRQVADHLYPYTNFLTLLFASFITTAGFVYTKVSADAKTDKTISIVELEAKSTIEKVQQKDAKSTIEKVQLETKSQIDTLKNEAKSEAEKHKIEMEKVHVELEKVKVEIERSIAMAESRIAEKFLMYGYAE
jgi:hypothetical protein